MGFKLLVKLIDTGEKFKIKDVTGEWTINRFKDTCEFITGIPVYIQRLQYLDEADLVDGSTVKKNDIVPGAILTMRVWPMWQSLIQAISAGDVNKVMKLGVQQNVETYNTPNLQYLNKKNREAAIAERAFIALYIAAHRGNDKMVKVLLDAGADVNAKTKSGRTVLHCCAAAGQGEIMSLLLSRGADMNAKDKEGNTALDIANKFNQKSCERHLFLFRWQQRAKKITPSHEVPPFLHQMCDTSMPVWKRQNNRIYYQKVVPPGEFEGTQLHAPKFQKPRPKTFPDDDEDLNGSSQTPTAGKSRRTVTYKLPPLTDTDDKSSPDFTSVSSPDIHESKPAPKHKENTKVTKRPPKFNEWLDNKLRVEKQQREARRVEIVARKEAERDRKLQKEMEDKSYDTWLAEKQNSSKAGSKLIQNQADGDDFITPRAAGQGLDILDRMRLGYHKLGLVNY